MKIVYVYREKRANVFSIEELFKALAIDLRKNFNLEIIEYRTNGKKFVLLDTFNLYRLKADIYHITGDIHFITIFLFLKKTILTIHDLNHYFFGLRGFRRALFKIFWITLPIKIATRVVAISSHTKKSVQKTLNSKKDLIQVINNGYNPSIKFKPRLQVKKHPILLHIGSVRHKNIHTLIEAIKGIDCTLFIVGRISDDVQILLDKNNIKYKSFNNITHKSLYNLYYKSDLVSFISLREGFGMPIIESQASGTPVITSNIPPMNRVAGKGSCLVNPLDIKDVRKKVKRLISDTEYRTKIIRQGKVNVNNYTIKKMSSEYYQLYKSLVNKVK